MTPKGMGCHPGPGVALLRALTEAAQARLGFYIRWTADDPARDQDTATGMGTAKRRPQGRRQITDGEAVRDFTTVPAFDERQLRRRTWPGNSPR